MICDLNDIDNIKNIIHEEGLNLLVVSYGGSCSTTLVNMLEKNNYKCRTPIRRKILCHCPHYIDIDIPIIYVYGDFLKSFMSMKKRGAHIWDTNQQKMSNNLNVELSDENLINCMINQFNRWTNIKRDNVLIIKNSELFQNSIVNKLEKFLKKKIKHFPIIYKTPTSNLNNIKDGQLPELFKKYKSEIHDINSFIA
jgi:hypothetical protein